MATENSTAHPAHPSTGDHDLHHDQDHPHACTDGVVYIGCLVEEDGDEIEVVEAVPCRRCAGDVR
jgi:hypothetical protein